METLYRRLVVGIRVYPNKSPVHRSFAAEDGTHFSLDENRDWALLHRRRATDTLLVNLYTSNLLFVRVC